MKRPTGTGTATGTGTGTKNKVHHLRGATRPPHPMPAMIEPAGKHEEPQTLQPLRGGGDISDDSTDSVPRKRPTVLQSVALISVEN